MKAKEDDKVESELQFVAKISKENFFLITNYLGKLKI
jgi:hypothetical protein